MNWRARDSLTPPQQYQFLRTNPICSGHGSLGPHGLIWNYEERPSALSREYTTQITFKKGDVPKVFIKHPNLELLAEGRPIPHLYRNPTRLCLYLPNSGEWVGSMRIDLTFVPWTATWLYYFEEWLASDDWKGGGKHPMPSDVEIPSSSGARVLRDRY